MSTLELKKRLINKIEKTEDRQILEEAFHLLEIESKDIGIYKLNAEQRNAMDEARDQIKKGDFLTGEEANKDIDESGILKDEYCNLTLEENRIIIEPEEKKIFIRRISCRNK